MACRWHKGIRGIFSDALTRGLRARQEQDLAALLDRAYPTDAGEPSYDDRADWERLERLGKMIALRNLLRGRRATFFTPPVLVVLIGGVVLALLATRVRSTRVEISARSTFLSFEPAHSAPAPVTLPIPVEVLSIAGDIGKTSGVPDLETGCSRIELRRAARPLVTLDPLELGAGASIRIFGTDPHALTMVVYAPGEGAAEVSASLAEGTEVGGCSGTYRSLGMARSLSVTSTPGGHLTLFLQLPESTAVGLRTPVHVKSLTFLHADDTHEGRPIQVSSVQGGAIYFDDLGDVHRELRPGQPLAFDVEGKGTIESMELTGGTSTLRFRGEVSNLRLESAVSPRSLLPTRLSWLMNRPDLTLLYSLTASGLLLLLSVKKWLDSRV